MSIWVYQNKSEQVKSSTVHSKVCIFCKCQLEKIHHIELERNNPWNFVHTKQIYICPICGWWTVIQTYCEMGHTIIEPAVFLGFGTTAILKGLDLTDISIPIEEVSNYLLVKYENRFTLNPRLFEDVVASVFRNMGYYARVTAYQNDGGIDVILGGKDNKIIGVQVKRYKNSIRVSQIREFAGALIENDMTKGIFVTTSKFQSGAYKCTAKYEEKCIGIELMDSDSFYDVLQIKHKDKDDFDEIIQIASNEELELVSYELYDYKKYEKE